MHVQGLSSFKGWMTPQPSIACEKYTEKGVLIEETWKSRTVKERHANTQREKWNGETFFGVCLFPFHEFLMKPRTLYIVHFVPCRIWFTPRQRKGEFSVRKPKRFLPDIDRHINKKHAYTMYTKMYAKWYACLWHSFFPLVSLPAIVTKAYFWSLATDFETRSDFSRECTLDTLRPNWKWRWTVLSSVWGNAPIRRNARTFGKRRDSWEREESEVLQTKTSLKEQSTAVLQNLFYSFILA